MPSGFAATFGCDWATSIRDRVALKLDWMTSAITDLLSLLLFESVMTFSCQKQKPIRVSNVLQIRKATTFSIGLLAFANVDAVFRYQLLVQSSWIFAFLDPARDIVPIAVTQIGNSHLLNESFR